MRYLDQEDWADDADTIDILIDSNFFMTNIPVQNVNDFKVENQVSFSVMNERQCCVQFGTLSSDQVILLDEFISEHTASNT